MTRNTNQRCTIAAKKLQLLGGELRLLKGTIEQLQGRVDLLLSEISELQHVEERIAEPQSTISAEAVTPDQVPLESVSDAHARPLTIVSEPVVAEALEVVASNDSVCGADPAIPTPINHIGPADAATACALTGPDEIAARRPASECRALRILGGHRNHQQESCMGTTRRWAAAAAVGGSLFLVAASAGFAYGFSELVVINIY